MPRSQRTDKIRQRFDRFTVVVFHCETGRALGQHALAITGHEVEIAPGLAPVEPDDGQEVLLLLGGKVENLACDLAVDVAGVDHQNVALVPSDNVPTLTPGPSPRGRGEQCGYLLQSRSNIVNEGLIENAKNLNSLRFKVGISLGIFFCALFMNRSIKFHRKFRLMAVEIEDIVTKLMLPTKFEPRKLTVTKCLRIA